MNDSNKFSLRKLICRHYFSGQKVIEKGIAVIGSTTIDWIVKEDGISMFKLGGVTTYSGITYSRHGVDTFVVSNVAKKDLPLLEKLHKERIKVCDGTTENTTHFVNFINGNNRKQRLTKKASPISYDQILKVLDRVSCLHLGPLHPMDIEIDAIKLLNTAKLTVFLDVQGYVRHVKDEIVHQNVSPQLPHALKVSQMVKANEAELDSILNHFKMNLADLMRFFEIEEFIVTQREKGGFVKDINGNELKYAAASIRELEDPTGAGDVFFASYIVCRYLKKMDIIDASAYAAVRSARQLEGRYIMPSELGLSIIEP